MQEPAPPDAGISTIVIAYGSHTARAGFAHADSCIDLPCIAGRMHPGYILPGMQPQEYYGGHHAVAKRSFLKNVRPVVRGAIADWEHLELVIRTCLFNEMKEDSPHEHALVMSEAAVATRADRERLAAIMFETYGMPALAVVQDSVLAMRGADLVTGLALSVGHGLTSAAPVLDGRALRHAAVDIPLAGQDITEHIHTMLQPLGRSTDDKHRHDLHERVKCAAAYVAPDFAAEEARPCTAHALAREPEVPLLPHERFRCAEILFQPALADIKCKSVPHAVADAIAKCKAHVQPAMWGNVVLYGGTAQLPGLATRLSKELSALAPPGTRVRVATSPQPAELVWAGAAALGKSEAALRSVWTLREEFEEEGPDALRRCG